MTQNSGEEGETEPQPKPEDMEPEEDVKPSANPKDVEPEDVKPRRAGAAEEVARADILRCWLCVCKRKRVLEVGRR